MPAEINGISDHRMVDSPSPQAALPHSYKITEEETVWRTLLRPLTWVTLHVAPEAFVSMCMCVVCMSVPVLTLHPIPGQEIRVGPVSTSNLCVLIPHRTGVTATPDLAFYTEPGGLNSRLHACAASPLTDCGGLRDNSPGRLICLMELFRKGWKVWPYWKRYVSGGGL